MLSFYSVVEQAIQNKHDKNMLPTRDKNVGGDAHDREHIEKEET